MVARDLCIGRGGQIKWYLAHLQGRLEAAPDLAKPERFDALNVARPLAGKLEIFITARMKIGILITARSVKRTILTMKNQLIATAKNHE